MHGDYESPEPRSSVDPYPGTDEDEDDEEESEESDDEDDESGWGNSFLVRLSKRTLLMIQ